MRSWSTIAVFCLLFAAAECAVRLWPRHDDAIASDAYLSKPAAVRDFREPIDVVAFGSSRVRAAFSPATLADEGIRACGRPLVGYNLGISAGFGRATLAMTTQVLARSGPPPRLALVYEYGKTVSSHYLGHPRERGRHAIGRSFPLSAVPSMIRAGFTTEQISRSILCGLFELLRIRGEVLMVMRGEKLPPDARERPFYRGWVPLRPVSLAEQRRRMRSELGEERLAFDDRRASYVDTEMAALEEAVRLLKAAGSKVILLDSPGPSEMQAVAESSELYARYGRRMRSIARRHGVPFVDHARPDGIGDRDFNDDNHLSWDGARLYTKKLVDSIVAPALGCRPPNEPLCEPVPELDPGAPGWRFQRAFAGSPTDAGRPIAWAGGPRITSQNGRTGRATSAELVIRRPHLVLQVAGRGRGLAAEIWDSRRRLATLRLGESEAFHPVVLDVTAAMARRVRLVLDDQARRGSLEFGGALACGRWSGR